MKKRLMSAISILLLGVLLFANCFNTNTNLVQIGNTEVPLTANEDSSDIFGMTNFANWRTGNYSLSGKYSENTARICLKDYVSVVAGQEYTANISNTNLHILVRELDSNNKFIKSYDLADKDTYTVSASCEKLGISLYDTKQKVKTFELFETLFQEGFKVTLTLSGNSQQEEVVEEKKEVVSVTDENDIFGMTNFVNWRTGNYSLSGKYSENTARICLKDYVSVVAGQEYTANISNTNLHILVRELDSNNKFIKSYNLADKDTYTVSASCAKLGISMYDTKQKVKTFDMFKTLFQEGFKATLTLSGNSQQDEVVEEDNNIVSATDENDVFAMTNFANWRTGNYSYSNGLYSKDATRICLKDYSGVSANQKYTASISNTNYHILVREMDKDGKFIKSYNLADKGTFTVSSSCVKIGISIYDTKSKTTSFDMYKELFQNGFKAMLILESNTQDDIVLEEETPIYGSSDDKNSTDKTEVVYPDIKSEIIAMIQNGDGTTHDVSKYHMKWLDVNSIFNSVVKNECLLEYECAAGIWISFEKDGDYAKAIKLNGMDDTYKDCLAKSKERIANVMAGIDDTMTDLDKALYCYDNLVINSKYSNANTNCYYGGNVLAYNTGACTGISSAYMLLLREAGIESTKVISSSMNHGWIMIKIDGKWYHADPTWDNTRYRYSNVVSRHYFMRNDAEYNSSLLLKKHYNWSVTGGYSSTSTNYTDWIVHDITVPMTYKDGYWYYTDSKTGHSMKIKLDGTDIIDLSM